jgi:hypothetical protein
MGAKSCQQWEENLVNNERKILSTMGGKSCQQWEENLVKNGRKILSTMGGNVSVELRRKCLSGIKEEMCPWNKGGNVRGIKEEMSVDIRRKCPLT